MLNEVVITRNSSSGGYSSNGYNWGEFSNYLNDPYFMNSQLRVGSGYSSGGYGGVYYVSPSYVPGSGSSSSLDSSKFRFDPQDNYEILYPKFTNTVNNVSNYVNTNPKVRD